MSLRALMFMAMIGDNCGPEIEQTTKHGIDTLQITLAMFKILEADDDKISQAKDEFIEYIERQIKRKLTAEEKIALFEGILKYINSEPASAERSDAMKTIFNCEFIKD